MKLGTLNDQLKYWKGQKKSVDWITPNGVIYPFFRHLTLHQFKPFSRNRVWTHKTRFGLGMCERIGIKEKYDNKKLNLNSLVLKIGFWGWRWKASYHAKVLYNERTLPKRLSTTKVKFLKYRNFIKNMQRGIIKWHSQIVYNVSAYCRTLHARNCLNV
tara:strand:+ start:262 stop:735 length:474 start_codon:yes stop_codon:yes gene_type:complete